MSRQAGFPGSRAAGPAAPGGAISADTIVVGAGIFGVTAACELARRGQRVALLDPGPVPHPDAASTDISKVVRLEYGPEEAYMAVMEGVREAWLRWNQELGQELFHEIGIAMLTREPMAPGGFEHESYQLLLRRGHCPERLDADEIARRFPAWRPGAHTDGFYHAKGGYAESGRVVAALVERAHALGVGIYPGRTVQSLASDDAAHKDRVTGVMTRAGERFLADRVIVAAGAWTPLLVPELAPCMRATGHPVFHLRPGAAQGLEHPGFCVFTADITNTGWYGFPVHPSHRVVKVARHSIGQLLHPERDPRVVTEADERSLREFLGYALPGLADAEIASTRRCVYCDTQDGHFIIDRHPGRPGLAVAAGGSGHGFKFAPIMGQLIADAALGQGNPLLDRFRWRDMAPDTTSVEAARYWGE